MTDRSQILLRVPRDLKSWVEAQAEINGSSQNSEIIRAIRERMNRTTTGDATAKQETPRNV